jgi:type I restriction enzyme S subunit
MELKEYYFGQIMSGFFDGPHATPAPSDNGPVFLGIKNIREDGGLDLTDIRHISEHDFPKWIKRVTPITGDIVFSYEATLHRYAIIPIGFHGCLGRRMALIRVNPDIVDNNFLYYSFLSPTWKAFIETKKVSGATVDRISIIDFPNYKIRLPELSIQKKIASIISAYDELIANNSQRIKLLEEMAEEIYKEWFVRLRFPGHEQTPIIDGLPEGWEKRSVFKIGEVTYGFPFKSSLFTNDIIGLPIIRIRDITSDFSGTYTSETAMEKYQVINGDLLVGMDGDFHIGKWVGGLSFLNQRVVRLRPAEKISKYYLYFSIKTEVEYLNAVICGTTVAHLSDRDLKRIELSVPDSEVMEKFRDVVDKMYEEEILLKEKNKLLKQTRDLLLPRLMSGRLAIDHLPEP